MRQRPGIIRKLCSKLLISVLRYTESPTHMAPRTRAYGPDSRPANATEYGRTVPIAAEAPSRPCVVVRCECFVTRRETPSVCLSRCISFFFVCLSRVFSPREIGGFPAVVQHRRSSFFASRRRNRSVSIRARPPTTSVRWTADRENEKHPGVSRAHGRARGERPSERVTKRRKVHNTYV